MPTRFIKIAIVALVALSTPALAQQIGYPPDQSPYRDLDWSQHFTVYGGYYHAHKDRVGAAPQSAPIIGVRYEVDIAGPAQFFVRAARVSSKRNAFDVTQPAATKSLGEVSAPLYLADVGFSFNLTGRKSWHSIVPVIGLGIGVASASKAVARDPYRFGTQFSFSGEAGVRIVPSHRYEIRLMLDNTFYQNHYPNSYYATASDGSAVLPLGVSKSAYFSNTAFTAGLSLPIFR
jgi:hypothetical protein